MKNMNFYDTYELGLNNEFLDKLSDNIILINNNGKILYANTSAIELYGYENDDIMNINIFDLMKKENIDNNDLFKNKVPFSAVHYRKDGIKFIGDVNILNFDISKDVMMVSVSNDEYCIFDRLISNAVKFTDEGFISFRTKILSEQDNKIKVEFRVKDTGIGIGENCKDKLFQYFSQDDSSDSKKYQGTGLGLAISKQIAELFNGELTYDSKAGQGSTFTLICEFEKVISKNHSEQSNTDTLAFNNVNNQSDKYTILCIEDNIINQEVLKNIITKKGYNYLPAYNGNEAFDILEVFNVDLILMDIQLPEINGFQITKIIRDKYDRENSIPIIAVTAYAMREDKEKCLNAGMNDS